jgi:phosphatidylglycerol lysyltransferase
MSQEIKLKADTGSERTIRSVPVSDEEREYVTDALKKYGYQSQSYNILLPDKRYFRSSDGIKGVIPYVVYAGVALGAGDPVCDSVDFRAFTEEFRRFCRKHHWHCCFQAITERFEPVVRELGFGMIRIGEEAIFDLRVHTWAGGKLKYLRRDVRRAQKSGIQIVEYKPLVTPRPDWEQQMEYLAREWLKFKGSGELSFLIGQLRLEQPGERKFFLALKDDQVEAFVVCLPIYTRNGIYFDIMRRRRRPVPGTATLLVYETFDMLKDQGYNMTTLGATPLSHEHLQDPRQRGLSEAVMNIVTGQFGIYRRHQQLQGFKDQFGPTSWESRYLAFSPSRFNPLILYVLLKAYNPKGISERLRQELGSLAWRGMKLVVVVPKKLVTAVPKKLRNIVTDHYKHETVGVSRMRGFDPKTEL